MHVIWLTCVVSVVFENPSALVRFLLLRKMCKAASTIIVVGGAMGVGGRVQLVMHGIWASCESLDCFFSFWVMSKTKKIWICICMSEVLFIDTLPQTSINISHQTNAIPKKELLQSLKKSRKHRLRESNSSKTTAILWTLSTWLAFSHEPFFRGD